MHPEKPALPRRTFLKTAATTGRITNDSAANALLRREYRSGWGLNTATVASL